MLDIHHNAIIQEGLQQVNTYAETLLVQENKPIAQLSAYLRKHHGKQIRTQLVLLMGGLLETKKITEKMRRAGAYIYLLHSASLLHDDVVDEATQRRYTTTLNAKLGNKFAVLSGDYLLATMFGCAASHRDDAYITLLTETSQSMIEGELLQLEAPSSPWPDEATYLTIIKKKTASLFAASCAIGAMTIGQDESQVKAFYTIGEQFGIAYQLYDDLLDYKPSALSGKTQLMDIKTKTYTLPLIYALQQATATENDYISSLILNHKNELAVLEEIFHFILERGGIDYTYKQLTAYQEKGLKLLSEAYLSQQTKDIFINLFNELISTKNIS